jgi:hypothetical protein
MQIDIVKNILASHERIVVAGEVSRPGEISSAIAAAKATVVVISEAHMEELGSYRDLLYRRPRLRVVALTAGGRQARVHELQPHVTTIVELSPAHLIAAIQGTYESR